MTVTATLALTVPLVAVIVALPTLTAVSCGPLITATEGLELVQTIGAVGITCPSRPETEPVKLVVVPEVAVNAVAGAIEIATGVVSGAVADPESPPQLAAASDSTNTRTIERSERKVIGWATGSEALPRARREWNVIG